MQRKDLINDPVFRSKLEDTGYHLLTAVGQGNYSTVVLAKKTRSCSNKRDLVALKILADTFEVPTFEQKLALGHIALDQGLKHRRHILFPKEQFTVDFEGDRISIMVFDQLCGLNLFEYARGCPNNRVPLRMAKLAILQAVKGLKGLHDSGIGHGGMAPAHFLFG